MSNAHLQFASHQELVEALNNLGGDPLEQWGGNIVIYRGNPAAKLMIIGEGPGANEDRLRKPFVGRSGKLLDQILSAVNFNPEQDVYISNVVRRRPPKNRDPLPKEIAFYAPYLFEEIRLLDPKIILLIGRHAMMTILKEKRGITKVRGQWFQKDGRWIMPMFHPAYLLRNPGKRPGSPKSLTWDDIRAVRAKYDELMGR
ncbi:MAG TPA: uracil-DNA glycosylase [Chloroflexi bacterium]|nr:uracil-DNA glycosylase [Chloroflexota bacterium]